MAFLNPRQEIEQGHEFALSPDKGAQGVSALQHERRTLWPEPHDSMCHHTVMGLGTEGQRAWLQLEPSFHEPTDVRRHYKVPRSGMS